MNRHHQSRRILSTLSLACLVLAACGDDTSDDETTATTEAVVEDATTTESTTTTVVAEGPEEWVEVAGDLLNNYFALLEAPDADRVSSVYAETCDCWQQRYDTVKVLADAGQRIEGGPPDLLFVQYHDDAEHLGAAYLVVKAESGPRSRVDADGEVVQEIPAPDEPACSAWTLFADGPDGGYRIHSELTLEGCPPGS